MQLTGLHHLTAMSARIRANHRFYTGAMGMRLVKRTVNQDDVSAYHLFYADAVGTPGTDLTFFDWKIPPERRGTRSIVRTGLRVRDEASLRWWAERLGEQGVAHGSLEERDGRPTLDLEDPEGQRLALVADGGKGEEPVTWDESPIPAEHQVRGLGPVVMSVPELDDTELVLTRVLEMRRVRSYRTPVSAPATEGAGDDPGEVPVHVFEMGDGGVHAELHVAVEPHLPPVRPGAGGVHHVAFRTPDDEQQHRWLERLRRLRIPNSGLVDRFYFRSLYFREPAGILFEIATDGPGFAVDEDPEKLGREVVLPPFLTERREEIVSALEPID